MYLKREKRSVAGPILWSGIVDLPSKRSEEKAGIWKKGAPETDP